jgi:formate hydrogenlyase subunit 3/multisubunit Na+/H+ antiporter MnhD subunit
MSAPLVWIGLPAIFAGLLFVLRPGKRVSALVGTGVALGLSALALWLPPESSFTLGRWVITLQSTFSVLGRQLVLGPQDQWLLVLLYAMLALWLGGSHLAGVAWNLPVLGLAMISLLIAALAVEPFLYAAIFIQMAVLLSIPLLVPRGKRPGLGSLRYLIFQTLGTPFILISGWMLGSGEIASTDVVFMHRVLGSLGLGFVMLLGVFPFHTWIPLLMEEIHPYVAGFLVWLLPLAISLFGLGFFERYTWLRESGMVYVYLQLSGLLMTLVGGISAAFETRLGRIFGNLVLVETGLMLLALGLGPDSGWRLYALMVFPRTLAYAVWSLAATRK